VPDPVSASEADVNIRESLRGSLLGKLLNPEEEGSKPESPPSVPSPAQAPQAEPPPPAAEPKKTDKTTLIRTVPGQSPEEQPPQPPAEPPKKAKPPARKAPSAPVPREAVQPQPVDLGQVARTAAQTAVETQMLMQSQQDRLKADQELPTDVKRNEAIYEELHRSNPQKYPNDLTNRMARYVKSELDYALAWEKAHPEEAYNADDEEHAGWYAKNQPPIDEEDFEDARVSVKARQIIQREVEPQRRELQTKLERQEIEPKLKATAQTLGAEILKSVAPEFDGKLTEESVNKIKEADPIAFEVASEVDNTLARVVYDGGMLWNGLAEYDDKNPHHSMARNIFLELETRLSEVNPSEIIRNGRKWAPFSKYAQMNPQERTGYYTTDYNDLVQYIRQFTGPAWAKHTYTQRMAESKNLVEKLASKMGYTKAEQSNSSPNEEHHSSPVNAIAASPVVSAGSLPPATTGPSKQESYNFNDEFFKRLGVR
jgi:hypothetical protein